MTDQKNKDGKEAIALSAIKEKAFGDCMTPDCQAALESIAHPVIVSTYTPMQ